MSGEDASERWLPTRSIATIMLSVISILSAPNFSSPANIDASVEMRKNPEAFNRRVKALVEKSLREKPADVKIPHPDTDPVEREIQIGLFFLISPHIALSLSLKWFATSDRCGNRENEEEESDHVGRRRGVRRLRL